MGIRTPDIQLAKLALYQLSYTPLLPVRRGTCGKKKIKLCAASRYRGRAEFFSNNISFRCAAVARHTSPVSNRPSSFQLFSLQFPAFLQGASTFRRDHENGLRILLRKEVIQPQVPLRLPCYDFIPVTSYTLGHYPLAVGACTSGATDFHDVTGGVYKTRERIHGTVDDVPLLAIPTSWRRVAASNPNWAQFYRFPPPRGIGSHCAGHCSTCAALGVRAILT